MARRLRTKCARCGGGHSRLDWLALDNLFRVPVGFVLLLVAGRSLIGFQFRCRECGQRFSAARKR